MSSNPETFTQAISNRSEIQTHRNPKTARACPVRLPQPCPFGCPVACSVLIAILD
ncbi:hypothetical protein RSSM_01327 [Rhodopirellula sallentina SM41]|uniref:Uncharacterized protein n=1 Tax=Rhodopirellula sallentina SM41 TaxID=1263870 RepID=M5UHB8_9BACT|nr:hypothetical protein RSSM_01327 [Rhodopirellula sallentina SM41]